MLITIGRLSLARLSVKIRYSVLRKMGSKSNCISIKSIVLIRSLLIRALMQALRHIWTLCDLNRE